MPGDADTETKKARDQVVVIKTDGQAPPAFEQIIKGTGYAFKRAESLQQASLILNDQWLTPTAVLVDFGERRLEPARLAEAAEQMPWARFLVVATGKDQGLQDVAFEALEPGRVLFLDNRHATKGTLRRLRRFLGVKHGMWAGAVQMDNEATSLPIRARKAPGRADTPQKDPISSFVSELSHIYDLHKLLDAALEKYLELLECEAGTVYLWKSDSETLVSVSAVGPEREQRIGLKQEQGAGLAGRVAQVQEPILVTDARKVPGLRHQAGQRYSKFSCLGVPVTCRDQLFGVVCLTMPKGRDRFDIADLRLAERLTEKLGSLLLPMRFISELRTFNELINQLGESCSELVREMDTEVESVRTLSSDILECVPVAIVAYDHDLKASFGNTAANAVLDLDPDGDRPDGVILEHGLELEPASWRKKLRGVLADGEGFRLNEARYHRSGNVRTLDIRCSPLHDSSGNVVGGVLAVQDVTQDMEIKAKLSSAEKLALIGRIAARVAHELNNPLDGILRYINLAARQIRNEPEKAESYLEQSRGGLLRMSHILTELLSFSPSRYPSRRPVSLSQVLRDALGQYERRAEKQNIDIQLDVPPALPTCTTNELYSVFGNVIKNAIDAMDDGGTLSIKALRDGDNVRVTVTDTGPGVPDDIREEIFNPFFTTKSERGGTGLGLAWCHDALERMGGKITLRSNEGGASFEMVVPVEEEEKEG